MDFHMRVVAKEKVVRVTSKFCMGVLMRRGTGAACGPVHQSGRDCFSALAAASWLQYHKQGHQTVMVIVFPSVPTNPRPEPTTAS